MVYKMWGSEVEVKVDLINNLLKYYVCFYKEDVDYFEMDDEVCEWFKKLENGDEEVIYLWLWFCLELLKVFKKIY